MMDSSWINTITHDVDTGTLSVEVEGGAIYDYHKVPAEVAKAFKEADSKGKYLNANIRDEYHYEAR
jgi:hypothetical protein